MLDESDIIGIVPNLKKSKMLGMLSDSFTLVATPDDTIFAKVTSAMLKQVVNDAKNAAKANGKGFLGQWKSQMGASFNYAERYANMYPGDILAENEANFTIPNSSIKSIKVKDNSRMDEDSTYNEWVITIQSDSGKLKFKSDFNPKAMLKQIYGARVK
jgi:hypothetical protein